MYILAQVQYIGYDWLIRGITKLLVIIAMLQLVKKLPELINTIFGTNIKTKGGIKGRLGEMAGIGGIAQKAWTSLGNGAKNLAKLGLTAPAIGAAYAANSMYKKKHGGKSFMDTDTFRKGKGLLYGARSALKSGSLLSGYQEYEKMSAPPQHSRDELMRIKANTINGLSGAGVSSQGTWTNEKKDKDGKILHENGKQVFNKRKETLDQMDMVKDAYHKTFNDSKEGKQLITSMDNGVEAQRRYNDLLGVQSSGEKVANFASNISSNLSSNPGQYSADEIRKASEISSRLTAGDRLVSSADADFLKKYMDSTTAKQFAVAVKKYDDALQTALDANPEYIKEDLISVGSLGGAVNNAKTTVDDSLSEQQAIVDKMSDADKINYQTYSSVIKQMTSSLGVTNQFEGDIAPTDLVTNDSGQQYHGWANDEVAYSSSEDVGTGIKTTIDSQNSQNVSTESPSDTASWENVSTVAGRRAANSNTNSISSSISTQQDIDILNAQEEALTMEENKLKKQVFLSEEERQRNNEQLREIAREKQRIAARKNELNGGTLDE